MSTIPISPPQIAYHPPDTPCLSRKVRQYTLRSQTIAAPFSAVLRFYGSLSFLHFEYYLYFKIIALFNHLNTYIHRIMRFRRKLLFNEQHNSIYILFSLHDIMEYSLMRMCILIST